MHFCKTPRSCAGPSLASHARLTAFAILIPIGRVPASSFRMTARRHRIAEFAS
jgi:hypothetical protein